MSDRTFVVAGNTVRETGASQDTGSGSAPPRTRDEEESGLVDLLGTGPLFGVVRRGYDRAAVDAYVESTEEELAALRRKLHTVLRRFHATADALVEARSRPEDRARDVVSEARLEAEARLANVQALRDAASAARDEARADRARAAAELAAARREAAELVAAAHAAREEAEATATLRMAALESETADLRRQRDEARAHLRRLTGQIEQALSSLTAVLPEAARPVPPPAAAVPSAVAPAVPERVLQPVREPDRAVMAG